MASGVFGCDQVFGSGVGAPGTTGTDGRTWRADRKPKPRVRRDLIYSRFSTKGDSGRETCEVVVPRPQPCGSITQGPNSVGLR